MQYCRRATDSHPYLYVDRECGFEGGQIARAMASGFGDVLAFMAKNTIKPVSMPMSLYPEMPTDKMRFRVGFLVSSDDAAKASGAVKAATLPDGEAMTGTHVGAYAGLGASHRAMWDHMQAEGIAAQGAVWEIYVDDPQATDEEDLRTEIFRSIG